MNKPITLTEAEQRLARYLAQARIQATLAAGVHAPLLSQADEIKVELESFGAELAYCRIMNCYPEMRADGYRPYDAIVGGAKVDVKQTAREKGRLIVPVKARRELPDYYALMIGRFPTYRLAGHMPAGEIIQAARIDNSLPNSTTYPAYTARQEELVIDLIGASAK